MEVSAMYYKWTNMAAKSYDRDKWPHHWTSKRCRDAEQYYLGLPEEFCSHSQLPVIAPTLAEQWIATCSPPGSALDFQEVMPGSGRLTLCAYHWGLAVGFPIDPL